jgi:hypothetical protein
MKISNSSGLMGGYREGSGRGIKKWFKSKFAGKVYLQSTWELAYAKYLDSNNIPWIRNTKRFPYVFENKSHYYVPDFYLVQTDEYIEIKGYRIEADEAKWKNFPKKLTVLYHKELRELGIL